ncbi:tyrosine-type recombinase/integrase [Mesobacillus subterraneus]|uniref:DNA integration/recombination/inversion protein n=1 Tax=Mesobacillus subterraneus TaxID=285983 RepID=A0A427TYD2_9BACI|nr:tyrosine-type recombinase/integrase [Mesobacillus subterraneus]RSD29462.1 DNA integration/recombination/inversion protein [Mesobacillus subterraneus]
MKTVSAIKSKKQINSMKEYLEQHSLRDYCLFVLGINSGIKLQELLRLRVQEVCGTDGEITELLGHPHYGNPPIFLNDAIRQALKKYINEYYLIDTDYLFRSRKTDEPITRQQAYRIINSAAREAGITEPVGTTTLRKTFGYHAYLQGIAISLIQKRLQQASPSETMQFIGIDQQAKQVKININL